MNRLAKLLLSAAAGLLAGCATTTPFDADYPDRVEEGFVSLFNGVDLEGWVGATASYGVDPKEPGVLQCFPERRGRGSNGNLCTMKAYRNFILRFEYAMPENGTSGLGLRMSDPDRDAAYRGMGEVQLRDDGGSFFYDAEHGKDRLRADQYTGSLLGIAAAGRDRNGRSHVRKAGQWNFMEVRVAGETVEVLLNGYLVTRTDVSQFRGSGDTIDRKKHPGLHNAKGRLGWLGLGHNVKWRNIRIRELPDDATLEDAVPKPDVPWREGGFTHRTAKDYGDFELWADGRLLAVSNDPDSVSDGSGIYLRGVPQVLVWDALSKGKYGSGGLYNNDYRKTGNLSKALAVADRAVGDWNRFHVIMRGEKVSVWLNGTLVVDDQTLENFFDRKRPVPARGKIELQCHGDPIEWRNVRVREL